jgi:hypothetical protein
MVEMRDSQLWSGTSYFGFELWCNVEFRLVLFGWGNGVLVFRLFQGGCEV